MRRSYDILYIIIGDLHSTYRLYNYRNSYVRCLLKNLFNLQIAKGIWCKLMFSKEENMREDQYVNVLEHQQKQKFLEWMKNQSELAGNVACSSISRFVWHTMSRTWKPKYDNEDECSLLIQFI